MKRKTNDLVANLLLIGLKRFMRYLSRLSQLKSNAKVNPTPPMKLLSPLKLIPSEHVVSIRCSDGMWYFTWTDATAIHLLRYLGQLAADPSNEFTWVAAFKVAYVVRSSMHQASNEHYSQWVYQ